MVIKDNKLVFFYEKANNYEIHKNRNVSSRDGMWLDYNLSNIKKDYECY